MSSRVPLGVHQYYDTNNGQFFLHHPFDADVIANVGPSNSFAEIYWEDKVMPFIGGTQEANENLSKQGIILPSEKIYRCPDDLSERKPFVSEQGQVDGVSAQLNRLDVKTAKGHTWTRIRVGNFRKIHHIPNYSPGEHQARGELTLEEAASRLGVSYSTVQRLIRRGRLPARQICARGPWILLGKDVEALHAEMHPAVNVRTSASAPPATQQTLAFPEDT
jgi:excisionase family DNA binding protein